MCGVNVASQWKVRCLLGWAMPSVLLGLLGLGRGPAAVN